MDLGSFDKELRPILRQVAEQGGRIERLPNGHPKVYALKPNDFRPYVTTSGTPSDWRSYKNFVRDLRKVGYVIAHKGGKR